MSTYIFIGIVVQFLVIILCAQNISSIEIWRHSDARMDQWNFQCLEPQNVCILLYSKNFTKDYSKMQYFINVTEVLTASVV
jgi:hypothetical protein